MVVCDAISAREGRTNVSRLLGVQFGGRFALPCFLLSNAFTALNVYSKQIEISSCGVPPFGDSVFDGVIQ